MFHRSSHSPHLMLAQSAHDITVASSTAKPLVRLRLSSALVAAGLVCSSPALMAQGEARAVLAQQGVYWQNMGRADLAEENWRKLLRLDPKSADALYGLAQVELSRNRADAAQPWLERLRAAHPDDPRLSRANASGPAMSDLQRARAAARAGQIAEALPLYRSVIGNQPPPPDLAREYYEVLAGSPQGFDEGNRGLEQLARQQPDNAGVQLALARVQTYREPTRRDGIRRLAELVGRGGADAVAARASWRQALIWLDARERDVPLYEAYLSGQRDEAVATRLQALKSSPVAEGATTVPPSPGAQSMTEGFRLLERGDLAGAEQRFQDALRRQPGYQEAQGGLGVVRLRQERFSDAQQLLEQASRGGAARWANALRSASYWSLVRQGDSARDGQDLAKARSYYERALRIDPKEPTAQLSLADLQSADGQFAEAERGYRRVLEIKADDSQALRGLILVLSRQGRSDEAAQIASRLTPEQLREAGGLRDLRTEQARAQARSRVEAGDIAGAQRVLEDSMLQAPSDPWLRLDLAQIYRRQGQLPQARSVMDGLLMSQPDMPDALYAGALLAADAGDSAAGVAYLERVPEASRTREMRQLQHRLWMQGQSQQALALARQGQTQAAKAVLARAEAALGQDMSPEIWGPLAEAYAEIGDAPRALAMSRQLLSRQPNPGIGDRLLYASVLSKTRQDVELSALMRQLQTATMTPAQRTQYDGLRIGYLLRQTDVLREAGNLEGAFATLQPVLAQQPDNPSALGALARLYSSARDEQQALALYQRVLQRNPTDLDTLLAAAASASALRAHDNAKSYVMAALKQAPDQSRVLAAAGRVYRNAGDSRQAEQYLQAAVTTDQRLANPWSPGAQNFASGSGAAQSAGNPFAGMTGGAPSNGVIGALPGPTAGVFMPAAMQSAGMPAFMPTQYVANNPAPAPSWSGMSTGGSAIPMGQAAGSGALPWSEPANRQASGGSDMRTAPSRAVAATGRNGVARQRMAQSAVTNSDKGREDARVFPNPSYGAQSTYNTAQSYNTASLALPLPVAGSQGLPSMPTETPWPTGRSATAPVNPVLAELQQLQAERSSSVNMGMVYRNRAGEPGLSRLSDLQIPIQGRFAIGEGKLVVSVTPTVLDAGTLSSDYPTASRFGGGPAAVFEQARTAGDAPSAQTASGVGLSVGYEGKNLNASIGTTPLGFDTSNVIGHVRYNGAFTDSLSYKAELSRQPVTDSLLSFAGTKDVRTGQAWGGVVATGGRLDATYDVGNFGIYGYGSYHGLTGNNVESNYRVEGGGGFYTHLLRSAANTVTVGMNVGLLSYDKNLSYFTYGHGGYFSPQRYLGVDFPVSWTGRSNRLSWRVNASLGVQSFTQDAAPYFPNDPQRQREVRSAVAQATALGLNTAAFNGLYPESSRTGLAYNLGATMEYQLAPQLYLGGIVGLGNARNYRQFTGNVYLRYLFGAPAASDNLAGPPSFSPISSPYTRL